MVSLPKSIQAFVKKTDHFCLINSSLAKVFFKNITWKKYKASMKTKEVAQHTHKQDQIMKI